VRGDLDPLLRRVERTAVVACGAMALTALALTRGNLAAAAAVLAGGALMAVSYISLKTSVGGLAALIGGAAAGDGAARRRTRMAGIALRMTGRYALLALLAYVMIARLRLHPLGLLAGVSSVVAAASIEAIRLQMQQKP
jgi:hypothetical protein